MIIDKFQSLSKELSLNTSEKYQIIKLTKDELKDLIIFAAQEDTVSLSDEYRNRLSWYDEILLGGEVRPYNGWHHTHTLPNLLKDIPEYIYNGFCFFIKVL